MKHRYYRTAEDDGIFHGVQVHCIPDDDAEALAQGVPAEVLRQLAEPGGVVSNGRAFFVRAADWEGLKAGLDRAGVLTGQ
jgi:hypothetical protein